MLMTDYDSTECNKIKPKNICNQLNVQQSLINSVAVNDYS